MVRGMGAVPKVVAAQGSTAHAGNLLVMPTCVGRLTTRVQVCDKADAREFPRMD